ncbi:unnamed protein product [Clonostachys rosea f. rosea IK726]|uniref:Uncharacterized protein n=2 Tax=Bionectria ochroleuca TaxID=29856 RepID=A0A0B7JSF2_BIOOC|nr:unnamed protein product [Clonostachys rosea f. rosea IK726]
MDSGEMQYLFKETRLNLEPPSSSVVTVRLPGSDRGQRKANDLSPEDETTFRSKNLASSSSIYHRQFHTSPRSFLWRVLEGGKILSVRAVDVCQNKEDALLVLNFHFATPIQPNCVAFSDPQEHDALCFFVLDQSYQLWTFTLRPDLFRKRSAIDAGLSDVAKRHVPAGLSFKHPYRMVAVSADCLLVTVNDGGMIRFDRNPHSDGSNTLWKETFFNVQGWTQNLRSLLPFQGKHTVKHGKMNMEYSAAASVQVTSLGVDECLFAVTVCLDHRMRIWDLDDGQILHTSDILGIERAPQEVGKWSIEPSQSNLVQIVGHSRGSRICATYSPVGAGEFKFWMIRAKGTHAVTVEDLFPTISLVPITPSSSDVWTLADFVLANPQKDSISIWTLWKNNMTYKVQKLDLDRENMAQCWEESWELVYIDTRITTPQASGPIDSTDVTEKWLQLILQPGRFTKSTLNTALSIYEQGLGVSRDASRARGLAESICSVLGSTASLERGATGAMDYDQFRSSSEIQWRRFYRLLVELDKQRGEAMGLTFDPETDMAWVVCADLLGAIRDCSDLERLYYNLSFPEEDQAQEAALVSSALSFVDGFSDNFVQTSNAVLRSEIFEESQKTDMERIQYFSDKAGFWRGITDEDCAQIVDALGQNFSTVTDELYGKVFGLIAAPENAKRRELSHPLSEFGRKLVSKATQDSIELYWKICFTQLILLVHMEFEFDTDDQALHNRVDIGTAYRKFVEALRRVEFLRWLAKTELSKKGAEDGRASTALEINLGHLLGFGSMNEPIATSITELVSNLCAPDSDIEISPSTVQCYLLKNERADLALDLAPFAEQSPFSIYVQGRVFLALQDFSSASIHFRKAAIGMGSTDTKIDRYLSSGLLDSTEWSLINHGLAKYYSHLVALYEKYKAYSYVVEFARLSIQFFDSSSSNDNLLKTDMLSRLFNAAVATAQFQLAHMTLTSLKDDALKHSSLRKLVSKMCETNHNNDLIKLPFPGMQRDVDEILAQKCKSIMDVINGFPYHQILYSWRIRHGNFRGAASILLDRIQKLRLAGEGDKIDGDDVLDTPVTRQYILLINALSCVDTKQAWIYDEGVPGSEAKGDGEAKRKVVSLADIRKQYQAELDRITAIQNNQFGFKADDVMDLS